MGEHAPPIAWCYLFIYFQQRSGRAGCCCRVLAKKSSLSCTADTPVTQRGPSIFSPRALSRLFVGDEESAVGGGVDQAAGGAEDEERKARELSKFSSQLLAEHGAPGTLIHVASPAAPHSGPARISVDQCLLFKRK